MWITYPAGWHAYGYGLRPNRTYPLPVNLRLMQQPVATISRAFCGVIVRMHSSVETYPAGLHAYGYGLRPNRTYPSIFT